MRGSIVIAVLLAALGAGGSSAQAAPNWRQPFVTAAPGSAPAVAVDNAGNTYVAYTAPDGLKVTRRAPGAGFDAPETVTLSAVPETQFVAGAAMGVDDAGNVTVAWMQSEGFGLKLLAATRPAAGAFEQPQTVDPDIHPGRGFSLAVGAGGLAAVAYASSPGDERLTVAQRQPGAPSWSAPQRIGSQGTTDTPRVAVGADGTVAATTGLYGFGPRAFVQPSATGVWGTEQDLDPDPQLHATAPSVAVDAGGGVLVAWTHAAGGGDYVIDARYRPGGAVTAFGAIDTLPNLDGFALGSEFLSGPALGFDPSGNATIVWRQYFSAGRADLYGATRPAAGPFGAPEPLATGAGAEYPRLAIDAGGTALVVWRGVEDPNQEQDPVRGRGPVYATTRPAVGSFAAPDVLAPSGGATPAVDAAGAGFGIASWKHTSDWCAQVESSLWNEGPAGPFNALAPVCPSPAGSAPPTGQNPPPLPRDTTAPRATVSATSRQRALKTKAVTLKIACDEMCAARVGGQIDHKPARRKKKIKALKFATKVVTGTPGKSVTVKFRLSKKQLATLKKMLANKGKATFTAKVQAADSSGNRSNRTRKIMLTR